MGRPRNKTRQHELTAKKRGGQSFPFIAPGLSRKNTRKISKERQMNILGGYDIEDFAVGMNAIFSKTITEADIILFAGVSGDNNAIHIDQEFAESTPFAGRIAHGMLTASVISAALANKLPGPGAIYINQSLNFHAAVKPGDTVHATVTVKEISLEKTRGAGDNLQRQRPDRDRRRGDGKSRFKQGGRAAGICRCHRKKQAHECVRLRRRVKGWLLRHRSAGLAMVVAKLRNEAKVI
jgi:3-hydroxybutyryl-CoA dehydratase